MDYRAVDFLKICTFLCNRSQKPSTAVMMDDICYVTDSNLPLTAYLDRLVL